MRYFANPLPIPCGKYLHTLLTFLCLAVCEACAGVKIMGTNGREVEFTALFDARPEGLVALVSPNSSAITVPWDRIDLDVLKQTQPMIHTAYQKAVATQKEQPLGMGIADSMLSLSQLPEALKQAIRDPYYWPYEGYSYQTIHTDINGRTTVRTYKTMAVYPTGYHRTNTPYLILKQMRDEKGDNQKKLLMNRIKSGHLNSFGVNRMLERMDYVLDKIPPEKIFPRNANQIVLIQTTIQFKKTINELLTAESLTAEHQATIKRYFSLLGID